jgi:hypothetical protein
VPYTAILAGCVIPDLPWILRRGFHALGWGWDPITTEAYFIAQASLFLCAPAAIAFGFLFRDSMRFAVIAMLGCVVHLLLDSLQIKWGNGVHLRAPFDWEHFQIGVLEIDTPLTVFVSMMGIVPLLMLPQIKDEARLLAVDSIRSIGIAIALICYLAAPLMFVEAVVASDSRDLRTLASQADRIGKTIELDREKVSLSEGGANITTHTGEILALHGANDVREGVYSVRGTFVETGRIEAIRIKRHTEGRDLASYVGLLGIAAWFLALLAAKLRLPRSRSR